MKPKDTILLAGLTLAITTTQGALQIDLAGNSDSQSWTALTASANPGYPNPFNPVAPTEWPEPILSDDEDAGFDRVSGLGYPASTSIYNFESVSSYRVIETTPLSGLQTVVFQLDHGDGFTSTPTLSYNGGDQLLPADFLATVPGDFTVSFGGDSGPSANAVFQWDLSGVVDPITAFEIAFSTGFHNSHFALNLDQSDTFTGSAIPEPAAGPLALLAIAALLAHRKQR